MHRRPSHLMAHENKPIGQLVQQLSIAHPPTPPTTSPDSPTPSDHGLPTTLDSILDELHRRWLDWDGVGDQWLTHRLSLAQFRELEKRIEEEDGDLRGFVPYTLKYDYFPDRSKFVLRMAGPLHEKVLALMEDEITEQLNEFCRHEDQSIADLARQIGRERSSKVTIENSATHFPDSSFGHRDASWAGLIIEVSHSQKRKDLVHLANDYIFGSQSLIRMMIGIDIDYKTEEKGARVLVWEARRDRDETGAETLEVVKTFSADYRTRDDGSLIEGQSRLEIPLKVFGNPYDCPGIDDVSAHISIPLSNLHAMVLEGEHRVVVKKRTAAYDAVAHLRHKRQRSEGSTTPSPSKSLSSGNDRTSDEDYADDGKDGEPEDRA